MIPSPEISVIVPIYNVEKYLRRCIDSILAQVFTNFELLLVDDGSTDSSGEICDDYSNIDHRIRVVHKANGGVSSARNIGLDNARGEWIAFIDADDWISVNYLMTLIENRNKAQLIIGSFQLENTNEQYLGHYLNEGLYNEDSIKNIFECKPYSILLITPWAKLFKSEVIKMHDICFDCTIVGGEDTLFVLSYFLYIDSFYVTNQPIYHYWRENGLSCQFHDMSSVFKFIKEMRLITDDFTQKYIIDSDRLHACLCTYYFCNCLRYNSIKYDKINELVKYLITTPEIENVMLNSPWIGKGMRYKLFMMVYKFKKKTLLNMYFRILAVFNQRPL